MVLLSICYQIILKAINHRSYKETFNVVHILLIAK